MKKVRLISGTEEDPKAVAIVCLGCNEEHLIPIRLPNRPTWKFNKNYESPTFEPSINIPSVCHFTITNGRINYCNDCSHELRGDHELPIFEGE